MHSRKPSDSQTKTVTARGNGLASGLMITLAAAVLSVVLIVLQAQQGGSAATWLRLLLGCALLCWGGWLFGGFARVVMTSDKLKVVNITRTIVIPASNIVDVREDGILRVDARDADGGIMRIRSWGGPAVKAAKLPNMRRMRVQPDASRLQAQRGVVSERYMSAMDGDSVAPEGIARTWNYREWAVLVVLLAINVAIWFH